MAISSDPAAADGSRRDLFRYLTAEESTDYLAIMDLFSATLLTDLSAGDAAGQLAEHGVSLSRDTAENRCRQLAAWGNLVPSIRDARVATVAEYIRSRSRYQVSKLGGRVHRRPPRCGACNGQQVDLRRKGSGAWYWRCYSATCPEHGKGRHKGWTLDVTLRRSQY